jgi:deoxycytidylate deaminase
MIIQSGIKEVVFISDKYKDSNSMKASRRMMNMAGVSYNTLSDLSIVFLLYRIYLFFFCLPCNAHS